MNMHVQIHVKKVGDSYFAYGNKLPSEWKTYLQVSWGITLSKSHMYMHCQGITLNTIFIITSTHRKITMQKITSPILHDESLYPIYNVAIAFCVQHVVLLSVFVLSQKAFIFTSVLSLTDARHEWISCLSPELTKPL